MRISKFLFSAALALTLATSGCGNRQSLSQHQCAAGDWQTVGLLDGRSGYDQTRLLVHQNSCGPHGVVPDSNAYRLGWQEGIHSYCDPQRGYDLGQRGKAHPNVCPSELRREFRESYDDGRSLYLARGAVARLERLLDQNEARLQNIDGEIIDATSAQLDPTLTAKERVDLLAETKALLQEKEQLRESLPPLAEDLAQARSRLATLEAGQASYALR